MRKFLLALAIMVVTLVGVILALLPRYLPQVVHRYAAEALVEYGVRPDVRLSFGYCWRNGPGVEGRVIATVPDTPWKVRVDFGASCCEWSARVVMPETRFDERDPLLRLALERFPPAGVSNLVFSGSVALEARAERTFSKPVPVWEAKVPIRDLAADLDSNGQHISVGGVAAKLGAKGIADHVDISPVFLRGSSVGVGDFTLTNVHASVRMTENALLVTEAGAGFCGGKVNVYSLFLDTKRLNTGFTLFVDDVDAGEALSHLKGFHGDASGRLHGKVKAFLREGGKAMRISDVFLYSTPGEVGKLKMVDSSALTDNLAYAGIDDGTRSNVADALTDLDYSVLRMDLKKSENGSARLTVHIRGTATRGGITVPVDITLNLNGEIEQLINTGLSYSAKLKGKKK